jgi:uncharacterized membrane protein YphA (DoxX/SURF4 family)
MVIRGAGTLPGPHGASFASWVTGLGAMLVGGALIIGFLTPLAGAAAAIGNSAIGFSLLTGSVAIGHDAAYSVIQLAAISIALVLLGPGAFSADAHLFGRREIIIPKVRP